MKRFFSIFFLAISIVFNLQAQNYVPAPDFIIGNGASGAVNCAALQPDGKIIIAGSFTSYNGVAANRIARINTDGRLDTSFHTGTGFDSYPQSMKLLPNGKMLIGGFFTSYNGNSYSHIIRLNSDGSIDNTFNIGTGLDIAGGQTMVNSIETLSTGEIIVGGQFNKYNGNSGYGVFCINPDGSFNANYKTGTGSFGPVYCIQVDPDNKVLIGGMFTKFNAVAKSNIVRLNADGSVDNSFTTKVGAAQFEKPNSIVRQSDGKYVLGGDFTFVNDVARGGIARINGDGSLDATFNDPKNNGQVNCSVVQPDNKIVAVGSFTNVNGIATKNITRLNANGSVDTSFKSGSGLSSSAAGVRIMPNGRYLVYGYFINVSGIFSPNIAVIQPTQPPKINTLPITFSNNKVQTGGTITSNGGSPIAAKGICWNTTGSPSTADSKTANGTGSGNFSSEVTGFANNTVYYVRAFATNSMGTTYGNEVAFTTAAPQITSFTPLSGTSGTTVTITGQNLISATAVSIGGTPIDSFIVISNTSINAKISGEVNGEVKVTTPTGNAAKSAFTYIYAVPTITSFTRTSAYAGQTILITGTNFEYTTGVTFGGTPAASFTILSPTSISALLGAGTSGSVSVITKGGTASKTGFTFITAPGNSLTFDGVNDYVQATSATYPGTNFTIEAWILTTSATGTKEIVSYGGQYTDILEFRVDNGKLSCGMRGSNGTWAEVLSSTLVNTGRWTHVAVSKNGNAYALYINGVLDKTMNNTQNNPNISRLTIGHCFHYNSFLSGYNFAGKIDEVRIWNIARTPAQIASNMYHMIADTTTGLFAYYSFDQGAAGINNTGVTTLTDVKGNTNATLYNFDLNGAASNWTESYALVLPVTLPASEVYGNNFMASWIAPETGTVNNYLLYVSTDSTFGSFLTGYNGLSVTGTSKVVTGININTKYYYKVAANKTSVDQQGGFSLKQPVVSTSVLPLHLLSFTGKAVNGKSVLQWQTSNETNTANFVIEASANGRIFIELGTIKAAVNSQVNKNYNFTNETPGQGNNYYRLKMIDADGSVTYSGVVLVSFANQLPAIQIYPTPATNYVVIDVLSAAIKPVRFTIMNSAGVIMKQGLLQKREEKLDISSLAAGVYRIQIDNGQVGTIVK